MQHKKQRKSYKTLYSFSFRSFRFGAVSVLAIAALFTAALAIPNMTPVYAQSSSEGDLVIPDSSDDTGTSSSLDAGGSDDSSYSIDDVTGSVDDTSGETGAAYTPSGYDATSPSIPETGGGVAGILMLTDMTGVMVAGAITMLLGGSLVVFARRMGVRQ